MELSKKCLSLQVETINYQTMIKNKKHSQYQKMLNEQKDVISFQYALIKRLRRDVNDFQEFIFHATETTDFHEIEDVKDAIERFNREIRKLKGYIVENEKLIKSFKKQIKLANR